jgi:hypothetical protein
MIKYSKLYLFLGFCLTFFSNYIIVLSSSKYNGYWGSRASDLYTKLMIFSGVEFLLLLLSLIFIIPKFAEKIEHKLLTCFGVSFLTAMMFYGSTRTSIVITSLIFCLSIFFSIKSPHIKHTSKIVKKEISEKSTNVTNQENI